MQNKVLKQCTMYSYHIQSHFFEPPSKYRFNKIGSLTWIPLEQIFHEIKMCKSKTDCKIWRKGLKFLEAKETGGVDVCSWWMICVETAFEHAWMKMDGINSSPVSSPPFLSHFIFLILFLFPCKRSSACWHLRQS